jgi:hypothetical protein
MLNDRIGINDIETVVGEWIRLARGANEAAVNAVWNS